MPLRDLEVRNAQPGPKPFKKYDGEGLFLLVKPNGSKLWRMRYQFAGKEKLLAFGIYPAISLATARVRRDAARLQIDQGIDPAALPEDTPEPVPRTFEPVAREWHSNWAVGLAPAHVERVLSRMKRDVFPAIGNKPLEAITPPDVVALVKAIEARGAIDISKRAHQSVARVFSYAKASGYIGQHHHNPAAEIHDALLSKPKSTPMPKIPFAQFPEFLGKLATYHGEPVTTDAIWFTLFTWARTKETRFAAWSEIEDLDGPEPLWRLPGDRMKMEREHLVPLSPQAAAVLKRAERYRRNEFVFPGDRKREQISENTMIYAMYRLGYRSRQTIHGLRGIASTWANEAEYNSDWIEMALSHADEDEVRAAYNSALYLRQRRAMLAAWGATVEALTPATRDDFDGLLA